MTTSVTLALGVRSIISARFCAKNERRNLDLPVSERGCMRLEASLGANLSNADPLSSAWLCRTPCLFAGGSWPSLGRGEESNWFLQFQSLRPCGSVNNWPFHRMRVPGRS